jgi:prolyl-tRNA editing enzyme YbaK/EbsC (Cys-tRNA(Pro) deacylase)
MKYVEAVERYGTDKPDVRFGLELQDVTHVVKDKTDFRIFQEAEIVKLVNAQGCGEWSRKEIDEMEAYVKGRGGKGLAYAKVMGGQLEGGISKFIPAEVQKELISEVKANENDLLFFAADKRQEANRILSEVRLKLGDLLGLRDDNVLSFAWVMDFPFYEKTSEGKIDFGHNPFSMPKGGIEAFDTDDPLTIESNQYDLTLNGYEILSGSIRNHDPEILLKAFQIVGYGIDEIKRKFGALYNAFQYGAPPHGGWAIGFDRMFMVFIDEPNIRDVYAFPLNSSGMDVMMNAPSELPEKELEILGLKYLDRGSAVVDEIKSLLELNGVEFKLLEHQEVRTSEEAAKVRNTKVSNGAKAMVLKSKEYNGRYTMVVVPADKQVDLGKVEKILGEKFEVASGEEVERYTGVKMGGVPPFGRLLKMDLYFDKSMWSKTESAFNCGRRDRSIIMQTKDLIKLAQPNKLSESSDFVS